MQNSIKCILLIVISIWVIGCKTDKNNTLDTIHIRMKKDPERINPLVFPNPVSREVYQYIHLPLADYDPQTYMLTPILIKSIPKEIGIDTGRFKGGIAFDIEFKDEAKWDDGTPITAIDYAFTMKAINLHQTNAAKYRELTENISDIVVDAKNPKKCRVIFSKDYLLALETALTVEVFQKSFYDSKNALGKYSFDMIADTNLTKGDNILDAFVADFNGNDYSRSKIQGSGPYAFVSWISDQTIELVKKKNYWGAGSDLPALMQGPDKMVFHIIPDEVTAFANLQNGQIDVMNEVSADKYESLRKDPKSKEFFDFFSPSLIKHYIIYLNNQDIILKDRKVRLALNHLTNTDNIIKNLENGMAERLSSPIHPIKKTYNRTLKPISFDLDAARKLLAEAGWKDSDGDGILDKIIDGKPTQLKLDILISGQELGKRLSLMLKDDAAKAGIGINIVEMEFKKIKAEHLRTRKYQMIPNLISQDIQAWDDLEGRWHSRSDTPKGSNEMSYHNAEVDKLIDKVLTSKNEEERIKLYLDIQQKIYDDCPAIFLYAPKERIIIAKKWHASSTAKRPGYMANTFGKINVASPVN